MWTTTEKRPAAVKVGPAWVNPAHVAAVLKDNPEYVTLILSGREGLLELDTGATQDEVAKALWGGRFEESR